MHLIYGYIGKIEKLLNINYCIPNGITNLCLVYYHIPIIYSPDPTQYFVSTTPNIKWDDVGGLQAAKTQLKESVILSMKFAHLFIPTASYRNNILLYGPSGVGKSYLAKAIATEANNITYFDVSVSDLVSKWIADADKLLQSTFAMAKDKIPSLLVFDEIDSFCGASYDSPSPRRMKTEFLVGIEGLTSKQYCNKIFLIGITNCPWDLDPSIRRRFQKRIYIPLPTQEARERIFKIHVNNSPNNLSDQDYVLLAEKTKGFTGSDICVIVQDAMMEPVRDLQNATHFKRVMNDNDINDYELVICEGLDDGAIKMSLMDIAEDEQEKIKVDRLEMKHFMKILQNARPTVSDQDVERHVNWKQEFGENE